MSGNESNEFEWDVFISHASEDQGTFVRPLASALSKAGYRVWYSEWELTVGDRLRATIERGLVLSRYGIVVVSDTFLAKQWPQRELDSLFALEVDGQKRILPVWHNVTEDQLRQHSPLLADRVALRSSEALDHIVNQIGRAIDQAPRVAAPSRASERRRLSDLAARHLRPRRLDDPREVDFGRNSDLEMLQPRRGRRADDSGPPLPMVAYSLVPLGDDVRLHWREILTWADEPHPVSHPLHNSDGRPRGEGVILRLHPDGESAPSRYTVITPEGYVEWGRTLGGLFAADAPPVVRLGPLLWGSIHLIEFLEEMRVRFDLRSEYELVVSIVNTAGSCLSHLGERWLEPWERGYQYYRPTTNDPSVQYQRVLPARISRTDAESVATELDLYLNRVWGSKDARGHNHPNAERDTPLRLPEQYETRDPWE